MEARPMAGINYSAEILTSKEYSTSAKYVCQLTLHNGQKIIEVILLFKVSKQKARMQKPSMTLKVSFINNSYLLDAAFRQKPPASSSFTTSPRRTRVRIQMALKQASTWYWQHQPTFTVCPLAQSFLHLWISQQMVQKRLLASTLNNSNSYNSITSQR